MRQGGFEDLILRLYPASYRRRFGLEWREVAGWHARRLRRARLARLRLSAVLVADALRSLPVAYAREIKQRLVPEVSERRGRAGAPGGGDSPVSDARHALRGLLRNPVFSFAAITSLGLGVGANTAIFSVVNAVLLEPLPYAQPDRLVMVWNEFPAMGLTRLPFSGVQVQALAEEPGLFEDVGGVWATTATVRDGDALRQVPVGRVTPNFLRVLGVQPTVGRDFDADLGEGAPPEGVLVSHRLWTAMFDGDPSAVGRTLRINGQPATVIGVLPQDFVLHLASDGGVPERLDVLTPLPWNLSFLPPGQRFLRVIGRLHEGLAADAAQPLAESAAARTRREYAEIGASGDRFTVAPLQADAVRSARPVLISLMGGVALFLVLASANVASLVLARAASRGPELAVRTSLGATRARLARLLVAETLWITVLGGVAGLLIGRWTASALWALRPDGIARVEAVPLDGTVLLFTLGAAAVAAVGFGVAPLLTLPRIRPADALRRAAASVSPGAGRSRTAATLVEIAIGVVLLSGAISLGRSLLELRRADLGFDTAQALTFKVALPTAQFPADGQRARLAREIEAGIRELPGVEAVGATSHLPLAPWANWGGPAAPEAVPPEDRDAYFSDLRSVTPGYFEAAGVPVEEGRTFDAADEADAEPTVVVDRAFAERTYPGEDVIGRTVYVTRYVDGGFVDVPASIAGVVASVRDRSPRLPSSGQVFWPFEQSARWELTWIVRSRDDPAALADAIRATVQDVHGDLAASDVVLLDEYVLRSTAEARFVALLGAVFAALALVLAALGLYGVMTAVTARRIREVGLRMALGADRRSVLLRVLMEGLRLATAGLAVGAVASMGGGRLLGSLLHGVSPYDPLTLAGVVLTLTAVAGTASFVPAWRASRLDPARVLRE